VWSPGDESQRCTACGQTVAAPTAVAAVHEVDYLAWARNLDGDAAREERLVVRCDGCGGETTFDPNIVAGRCAFCDSAITAQAQSRRVIKPHCVLPFKVTRPQALETFGRWLGSRWFAPSALKRLARADQQRLRGIYMPFWTYDARAATDYDGLRGTHYYTTETYTTQENGRTVTHTRQVRHTSWSPASGSVENVFDDILVAASGSVSLKFVSALEPWDLEAVVPYRDEYIAGFECESYQVTLEGGFEAAQAIMSPAIDATIRADIGGDEQQISDQRTTFGNVSFKHLLLPVWICSYRYRDKVFHFLVNARTGEVQGERPWSWVKITSLVIALAAAIAAIAYYYSSRP
jgi:ribosomal protein S27E